MYEVTIKKNGLGTRVNIEDDSLKTMFTPTMIAVMESSFKEGEENARTGGININDVMSLVSDRSYEPSNEEWMGDHIIYWFTDKSNLTTWVEQISKLDYRNGTIGKPRFGGNFIDAEPTELQNFINWVWDDSEKIGLGGYDSHDDLTIEEIIIKPKKGIETKKIRRQAYISKADEVSDTREGYVRCWWD